MPDTPLPSHQPLPTPRRSWIKTAVLGLIVLLSGMIIGSGLTVIGIRRVANQLQQRPDMFSNRILGRMEQDLHLTKNQKTEMGKIFKDARGELEEMRGQHRAQGQAFFKDFHDKVTRVLTPDQQKEWEAWWKAARERALKERPGVSPRPQGQGNNNRSPQDKQLRSVEELQKQDPARPPAETQDPPQGIPEHHFSQDPSAPTPENQPEPNKVPAPN